MARQQTIQRLFEIGIGQEDPEHHALMHDKQLSDLNQPRNIIHGIPRREEHKQRGFGSGSEGSAHNDSFILEMKKTQ